MGARVRSWCTHPDAARRGPAGPYPRFVQPSVPTATPAPLVPPWVAILGLGLHAGLLVQLSHAEDTKRCGVVGECLGNAITAGLIALAIPVLVSVALLVLRFPGGITCFNCCSSRWRG